MKTKLSLLAVALFVAVAGSAFATVRYVDANSTNATPPYTNWATAAATIQDAVDAAAAGDEIVVTNGTYATGGRAVGTNLLTNRVAVDKPLTVRSVNGPQFTVIQGYHVPGTTNGDGAIRCAYLTNGAVLNGFTLTNGATRSAGDYYASESGGGLWAEPVNATATNCVLSGNSAYSAGGGAMHGTLSHCTLTANSAQEGGGICYSFATDCVLSGNSASSGGGAKYSTLNRCTLDRNSASFAGGGAGSCAVDDCMLGGNSASSGGGAFTCTLTNSVLIGNSAADGAGTWYGTLINCTLAGNSATHQGGGGYGARMTNCIVYFNTAPVGSNYDTGCALTYCCTAPRPLNGAGNVILDPLFVDAASGNLRLQSNSPCINAGNNAYAPAGPDLDGLQRIAGGTVDLGAYEFQEPISPTAPYILVQLTNQIVNIGMNANFNMAAFGTFPLTYQWRFNGTAISGATNDFLVVTNAQTTDAGAYSVLISNAAGTTVSSNAVLFVVPPAVRFVNVTSISPAPPYTNWETAAQTIQDAVDAALPGDEIVVTNGTYAIGGRAVSGTMTNRVALDKPLTLRSVNGPQFTVIQGYQVPGTTNGDGAIRCVYLTNGASVSGFTLTNGATRTMGNHFREQFGGGLWCESKSAIVSNCVLAGNAAYQEGGGAYQGTLNFCKLSGNWAEDGGGAAESALNNCALTGNAASYGGGAWGGTLNNCAITGNAADWHGGGAYGATLSNCTLTGNSAQSVSGGAYWSTFNNCIVYFNTAPVGANYYQSRDGIYTSVLNYCCTTPQPPSGIGNISLDPQLANAWRLSPASPCRAAGNAAYVTGEDLDGEPWNNPPSIGCDEFYSGALLGDLNVGIVVTYTNVAVNYSLDLTALIDGRASASVWHFGDGEVASNRPYATHLWTTPGDYAVILTAYNDSHSGGVSATQTVHVGSGVHYVAAGSTNPLAPYLSWATAARTIQDAVDAASLGALVLVTNGTYATGGRAVNGVLTNRVAVDKPLTVRSVNGPQVTVIQGYQLPGATNGDGAVRCAYLANGTALIGFTLANGATRSWSLDPSREASGGGLWCESGSALASNCVITGNAACYGGAGANGGTLSRCTLRGNSIVNQGGGWGPLDPPGYGGGARAASLYGCILTGNSALVGAGADRCGLVNCLLTANVAVNHGGGAWASSLINCTVTSNSAINYGGGGASECNVINSIVYYNTAPEDPDCAGACYTLNSCTPPAGLMGGSTGNITNAPLFAGNLRLQSNSPCINAGLNAYATGPTDLDGNPRIVHGTVDIGAYEFQGPGSVVSYAWLQQYGLPTNGSADYADADGDGMNNWQEWLCGTDPKNAASVLRLLSASPAGSNVTVTWQSVAGMSYFLERSTDLTASPPFTALATNRPGLSGTTSYTDTNAAAAPRLFYRVGVPH